MTYMRYVWQCVAVCGSVLRCVAVCCSVLQCVAVCCSMLQCVAVCCSMLQCVAVCCSVLQCVAVATTLHDMFAVRVKDSALSILKKKGSLPLYPVFPPCILCLSYGLKPLYPSWRVEYRFQVKDSPVFISNRQCTALCSSSSFWHASKRRTTYSWAATHYNTLPRTHELQHTTTHCNTLQHTATRNTLTCVKKTNSSQIVLYSSLQSIKVLLIDCRALLE